MFHCFKEESHPINISKIPDKTGIFQHDSAPCHKSKFVTKYLEENNVKILDWPGNSPDFYLIENLWAILKKHFTKEDGSSKIRLIRSFKCGTTTNKFKKCTKNLLNLCQIELSVF